MKEKHVRLVKKMTLECMFPVLCPIPGLSYGFVVIGRSHKVIGETRPSCVRDAEQTRMSMHTVRYFASC